MAISVSVFLQDILVLFAFIFCIDLYVIRLLSLIILYRIEFGILY